MNSYYFISFLYSHVTHAKIVPLGTILTGTLFSLIIAVLESFNFNRLQFLGYVLLHVDNAIKEVFDLGEQENVTRTKIKLIGDYCRSFQKGDSPV